MSKSKTESTDNFGALHRQANVAALFQRAVNSLHKVQLEEAETLARQVLEISPQHADASHLLGIVLYMEKRLEEALFYFDQAVHLRPGYPEAYNNRGNMLRDAGRMDEALSSFDQAILLRQDYSEAYNNRGNTLQDMGRPEEALASFEQAIAMNLDHPEPHINKGNLLTEMYRIKEALASYDQALQLRPGSAEAYFGRGNTLRIIGCIQEACDEFAHALEVSPDYMDARVSLLLCSNCHPDLSPEQVFELHRKWCYPPAQALPLVPAGNNHQQVKKTNRLRVGYVSPDFLRHSVAFFFEPLLRSHHKDTVEVYCYSNVKYPDEVTRRMQAMADHWVSIVNVPDADVAEMIQQDGIDVLVDLAGYTGASRLSLFAYRPAPVQVTWLGYPNTTGMTAVDYRITDAVADPEGMSDRLHTETLVRLENGFLCYQPHETAPDVSSLPALEAGHVTFGSFNNLSKITPHVVAAWAEILHELPESRIIIKNEAFTATAAKDRYLGLFSDFGINAKRIDLYAWLPKREDHLDLYKRIDIALDTFPYNGTTTTCEALWMGVPIVTHVGNRHASRVGATILERVGTPEWGAVTITGYIENAVRLATDFESLAEIRHNLRNLMRTSTLCDADGFASSIEDAYKQMCRGSIGS